MYGGRDRVYAGLVRIGTRKRAIDHITYFVILVDVQDNVVRDGIIERDRASDTIILSGIIAMCGIFAKQVKRILAV